MTRGVFFVAVLFSVALFSCDKSGFSLHDISLIGHSADGIMPLFTTDDYDDSLFLRQAARPLTRKQLCSDELKVLEERMLATVTDPDNEGVGIAAPQVGLGYALVAVQRLDKTGEPFEFYANPVIVWRSERMSSGMEGCLSVPGYYGSVVRSDSVEIEYTDRLSLERVTERIGGMTAVIFQHEIDHLEGVLFVDRAESLEME